MYNKLLFLFIFDVVMCKAQNVEYYKNKNNTKVIINITEICTENKPCITKCCGLGEVVFRKNHTTSCKPAEHELDYRSIKIYDRIRNKTITNKTILDVFTIVHTDWFISYDASLYRLGNNDTIYDNGGLMSERIIPGSQSMVQKLDYCIDFWLGNEPLFSLRPKLNESYLYDWLLSIAMYVTALFLLLNFIIYCILPDLSIMEMMRAAYVASMTLSFTFKASINLSLLTDNLPSSRIQVIAPITYFVTLSTFCWLSMMSLDIWWTLRGIRKNRDIHRKGINHKFMVYCIYCYGLPALMTIAAVSVDFVPSVPPEWKPRFKNFFTASSGNSLLYYLHIPLFILVILNWVLFVMTVYNIWLVKRAISNHNSSATTNTQENLNRFKIYLKLSLVMGISWILEMIQSTINMPVWLMITVDIYHALSGIIIFYIFVIDKSIFRRLEKKFGIKLPGNDASTINNSSVRTNRTVNSRHGSNKPKDLNTEDKITNSTNSA